MINLYINERKEGDVTFLDLKGRLRMGNTVAFHRSIQTLILEKKVLIVLNLAGVTHIDSGGIGELVAGQISARNKGGEIKLLSLTDTLHKLLKKNGLMGVFQAYDNEADAVESFAEYSFSELRVPRGLA